jgi:hypothetical protein
MKNIVPIFLCMSFLVQIGCTKNSIVPPYTPPTTANFTVTALNHTKDTVSVGDTIYLTVAGTMYDTLNVYTYLTIKSTASGSPVYSYGSSASPVKIKRVLASSNVQGTNPWTSTIALTGLTTVPNTTLTISGTFIYQLSLSSEGGGMAPATDLGVKNKSIFVQ